VDQARSELNARLGVDTWRAFPASVRVEPRETDEGPVPYWWHGDEDASSSFLASQGVVL
jgi:hypothetical protein